MTFKSTYSKAQVSQEVVSRIGAIVPGNIMVMDANGFIVDSGISLQSLIDGSGSSTNLKDEIGDNLTDESGNILTEI